MNLNLAQSAKQAQINHQSTPASQITTFVVLNWTTLLMFSTLMTLTISPAIINAPWSMNATFGPISSTSSNVINASFSKTVTYMRIAPQIVMINMKTVFPNVQLVPKIWTSLDESCQWKLNSFKEFLICKKLEII